MEFPDLGQHCHICRQLDFLPFVCYDCKGVFCLEHKSHDCTKKKDICIDLINIKKKKTALKCPVKRCKDRSLVEYPCKQCQKHYCVKHRFHKEHIRMVSVY